jgi:hypothetical protein
MGGCRVAAYDKDTCGLCNFRDGVCHGTATQGGSQTGYRRGVSEAGTVVDIVCPHDGPDKLLKEIVFFISTLGRRYGSKLVSLEMIQGAGHILDGLIPRDFNKIPFSLDKGRCYRLAWRFGLILAVFLVKRVVCPNKWSREPVWAVNELITKTATDTKLAPVHRIAVVAPGANDGVSSYT